MKSNTKVYNAIRKQTAVKALPRLIAEFNHNRYALPTADNSPPDLTVARDPDIMPIESIVGPNRPRAGCLKASVDDMDLLPDYNPLPNARRFHVSEEEDYYKYWSSPSPSNVATPTVTRTNYATNPSFEIGAAYKEIFRNYMLNPSLELNTTQWAVHGGSTIQRVIEEKYFGTSSLKVNVPANASASGTITNADYINVSGPVMSSIWVKTDAPRQLQLIAEERTPANAAVNNTTTSFTSTGTGWQRVSVLRATHTSGNSIRLYLRTANATQPAFTFYADGAMVTTGNTLLDYFDGSTTSLKSNSQWVKEVSGFVPSWTGTPGGSASILSARALTGFTDFTGFGKFFQLSRGSIAGSRAKRGVLYNDAVTGADNLTGLPNAWFAPLGGVVTVSFDIYSWNAIPANTSVFRANITGASPVDQTIKTTSAIPARTTTRVVGQIDTTGGTTLNFLRLMNGSVVPGNFTFFDNIVIESGATDGSYFDGATPDTSTEYAWVGLVDASRSTASINVATFPTHAESPYATDCNPQVTYSSLVNTNKIVIGLENSLSSPVDYDIYIQTAVGGAWTKIADETTAPIDANGRINVYRQSSSWSGALNRDYHLPIAGIQMRVNAMDKTNQYLQLIEIAATLEKDLSPWVQTVDDTFDLGDTNVVTPIGRISANIATLQLFNGLVDETNFSKGLLFNNENTDSIYYGLLRENVKFTLDYEYDTTQQGGTESDPVRQLTMYSEDDWGADLEETVSISVRDAAKFLQEIDAPQTFYESKGSMSIGEIAWRLLDSIGFVDYHIDIEDTTDPLSMDFFWCDGTEKVWTILSSLAEGTQTAIYFDAYGVLQIKTKETAFKADAPTNWIIRGDDNGDEITDLAELTREDKDPANSITISYKPVDYKATSNNTYLNELMWEPEVSPVILRSSDLQEDLYTNSEYIKILAIEAQDWQYTGFMQVEGELIEYEGKLYTYYDSTDNNQIKSVVINSNEDFKKYYNKTDRNIQFLNRFTGHLKIKQRGLWNTEVKNHPVRGYTYQTYKFINGVNKRASSEFTYQGSEAYTVNGIQYREGQKATGRIQTNTGSAWNNFYHASYNGGTLGVAPKFYGMRFRSIHAGMKYHTGGLMIAGSQVTGQGYFIEFKPSNYATPTAKEITVYVKQSNGNIIQLAGAGFSTTIIQNTWYDVDVQFNNTGTNDQIIIWVNGQFKGIVIIPPIQQVEDSDCFGMFARASSALEFEYLYAFDRVDSPTDSRWGNGVSFYDRVINGFVSNQSSDEFTNDIRKRRTKKKNKLYTERYATKFFDEFTPVVHEMREFKINYTDKLPGTKVTFLATNQATARYLDVTTTPWGAHFYALNASHNDVEIHGEGQKMGIYCQNIAQGEERQKVFEDEASIRVSGKKEYPFTSDWIQSDSAADNLGKWITGHWDSKTDELSATIFGNTLVELTDIVEIYDPQSDRNYEKYFVIAVSTDYDQGLSTTLRLRRVKI